MALEVIRTAPKVEDFTPLFEHQSQTPGTFFGGKPILHYHTTGATLTVDPQALESHPALGLLSTSPAASSSTTNGDSSHATTQISDLSIFVTTESFTLFSPNSSSTAPSDGTSESTAPPTRGAGIKIPYPTISMHARTGPSLTLILILSDSRHTADEDLETVELVLTPSGAQTAKDEAEEEAKRCYDAVSACADLHPDPTDSDEEGEEGMGGFGGMQEPGAGGWITAENMHEFMDEDGNLGLPEQNGADDEDGVEQGGVLGPGAGSRRTADEAEEMDGLVDGEDETKWRRTG